MQTISHLDPSANPACDMPGHGRPDADSPCCRPEPAPPTNHAPTPGWWRSASTWRRAARNTAHCLLGCSLGDILVMTLVPHFWPAVAQATVTVLAILAGLGSSLLLETLVLRWREAMAWRTALRVAFGMSMLSMVAMELAMNLTDWLLMCGQRMPIDHLGYWLAWIPSALVGFAVPLPYNYYKLRQFGRSCH